MDHLEVGSILCSPEEIALNQINFQRFVKYSRCHCGVVGSLPAVEQSGPGFESQLGFFCMELVCSSRVAFPTIQTLSGLSVLSFGVSVMDWGLLPNDRWRQSSPLKDRMKKNKSRKFKWSYF